MNYLKILPVNLFSSRVCTVNLQNSKRPVFESIKRGYPATYEGDGKTTATIVNIQENLSLLINSFSPHGFRLSNNLFVKGSLVIFPSTTLSWQVHKIQEANEASFTLFRLLDPTIDVLVIGVGDKEYYTRELRESLTSMMRKFGISTEVLPTETACSTYNFLAAEQRFVAAALIPPRQGFGHGTNTHEPQPPYNVFA